MALLFDEGFGNAVGSPPTVFTVYDSEFMYSIGIRPRLPKSTSSPEGFAVIKSRTNTRNSTRFTRTLRAPPVVSRRRRRGPRPWNAHRPPPQIVTVRVYIFIIIIFLYYYYYSAGHVKHNKIITKCPRESILLRVFSLYFFLFFAFSFLLRAPRGGGGRKRICHRRRTTT